MEKHILVTNDDGVLAPGLLALVQEMRKLRKGKYSWAGPQLVGRRTCQDPRSRPARQGSSACRWNPGLCQRWRTLGLCSLGRLGLFKEPVDLVVSGINVWAPISGRCTYSGTVTAAMEAVIANLPGIAVHWKRSKVIWQPGFWPCGACRRKSGAPCH